MPPATPVSTNPIGSRHYWCLMLLHDELAEQIADRAERADRAEPGAPCTMRNRIVIRSPLPLDDAGTVEPDLVLLRERVVDSRDPMPGPRDVLMVAEVSETSLAEDLGDRALLYARAGIPEYWVVDVEGRVIVHRGPFPDGYASVVEHPGDARIDGASHPDLVVDFTRVFV